MIALAITATAVLFFMLVFVSIRTTRSGEWHSISPTQMRRFLNGKWETRPPSEAESLDAQNADAW